MRFGSGVVRQDAAAAALLVKEWVLGGPEELAPAENPEPGPADVLVRVDAIAVCAIDIEIISPRAQPTALMAQKRSTPS